MLHELPVPKDGVNAVIAETYDVGLNQSHAKAIGEWRAHAIRQYPREAVGALTTDLRFVPLHNGSPRPYHTVLINPNELLDAGDLAGIVHSHTHPDPEVPNVTQPQAAPSKIDMENQVLSGVPWGVSVAQVDCCTKPIWWGDQLPIRPWLARPFVHGIMDCCTIIRDYHRCQGIDLPEVPRDDRWWLKGGDLYMEHFKPFGFREVRERRLPKEGDMFICAVHSQRKNHAGMVIDSGRTLIHHLGGMLSNRSPTERWISKLNFLVRHEALGD